MLKSIKNVYIVGPGPSSSHTIGPFKATNDFILDLVNLDLLNKIFSFKVTLFGSLALTGKGHLTDKIILDTFKNNEYLKKLDNNNNIKYEVIFDINTTFKDLKHPNTMKFECFDNKNYLIYSSIYFSIGGGEIKKQGVDLNISKNECELVSINNDNKKSDYIYPFSSFKDIKSYVKEHNDISLKEVVDTFEDKDINSYLKDILNVMIKSVDNGLNSEEKYLPGSLKIVRVAKSIYKNIEKLDNETEKVEMLLTSFAYSVAEENASGKMIVTAPTCGSAGIIPSIMYFYKNILNYSEEKLIDSLKVGAIFALLAKENASISGAVGGCQAEIGVASAMGAAILSYLNDLSTYQIEYASEVALEHFLGLTCDPVKGYVQVPCIERNGVGVLRSFASFLYAKNIAPLRKNLVSFDDVLKAMKITGDDLNPLYKETSEGGLAKIIE